MDQGIIQNLKVIYRRFLTRRYIACIDNNQPLNFDLLDSLLILRRAWQSVTEPTIKNCFAKAGFSKPIVAPAFAGVGFEEEEPEDTELQQNWDIIQHHENLEISLEDFIGVDEQLLTTGNLTIEDIVSGVVGKNADVNEESEEEPLDEIVELSDKPPITRKDALQCLDVLSHYMQENTTNPEVLSAIEKLDDELAALRFQNTIQTQITDFFS
jgi:hypothetical protein